MGACEVCDPDLQLAVTMPKESSPSSFIPPSNDISVSPLPPPQWPPLQPSITAVQVASSLVVTGGEAICQDPHLREAVTSHLQAFPSFNLVMPLITPPVPPVREAVAGVEGREEKEERRAREERKLKEEWIRKMRGWLMIIATLAASVTFNAGLNPPGGFWQDDLQSSPPSLPPNSATTGNSSPTVAGAGDNSVIKGHTAGDPILADKSKFRYYLFVSFNTGAFGSSIAGIVLLLDQNYFHAEVRLALLKGFAIGELFSMAMAYVVGITRGSGLKGITNVVGSLVWTIGTVSFCVWRIRRKSRSAAPICPAACEVIGDVEAGTGGR